VTNYEAIRDQCQPGDVLAFGGDGVISAAIRLATKSNVSHVGCVHYCSASPEDPHRVMVIEVTSLNGQAVVQHNALSFHVAHYPGRIWLLQLRADVRARMNIERYQAWGAAQLGKTYDFDQAIGSAIDVLPEMREDFAKLFCSELVAAMLEEAGAIGEINASEQTPSDVVRFPIYERVIQLRGEPTRITIR